MGCTRAGIDTALPVFQLNFRISSMIHEPAGGAPTTSTLTRPTKGIDITETLARRE
jgi:hypothetical protein